MSTKGKLAKAGFERIKNYTNSMTKNSTNNMSKNGTVDKLIDKHFARFDNLVKNKRKEYMDAAKSIRPNTNNEAAAMAVGAAGTYGVMKANEKKKVKVEKKPRKVFMNTKMRD
jgi:hypothetical protein